MVNKLELRMRREHRERYAQLAERLGIEALKELVPTATGFPVIDGRHTLKESLEERLRLAYKRDRNLNNIPMPLWDAKHRAVVELVHAAVKREHRSWYWSKADSVAVLKHVARYHIAGVTFEEDDVWLSREGRAY